MDTKALRQKILDLAIRGKLVPQDPNDELASVLLERIRQQKQQMVKQGKLKPKDIKNDSVIFVAEDNLHYEKFTDGSVKCIEDEIPFDLPEGWAWARLQSFVNFIGGSQPPKSTFEYVATKDNIRLIQIRDYKTDRFLTYIPKSLARRFCSKDDVMIGRYGPPIFQVLRGLEGSYNVALMKAVSEPGIMLNDYLFYLLQDGELLKMLESLSDRTCGQDGINMYELNRYIVGIPPLDEQNRITQYLISVLPIVDNMASNKAELESLITQTKAKILDLAIRGQLVPQDPNDEPASVLLERIRAEKEELIRQGKIKRDKKESVIFRGEDNSYYEKMPDGKLHCLDDQLPFELPDSWEWCNLSMIGTTNIGLTYRPTDIEPDGVIVLRSCNIVNDQVDLSDLVRVKTTIRENQYVQKNDILICARNGSRALVGKCALIPDLGEPASFGAFMAIYRTEYFEYIVHYLRSSFFRSVFDDSNSTAINQLTQDMLKRAIVPLPPVFEQRRITETIDAMLFELNQTEESLS